jgi:1-acyl-sn-glycerol-3-phosphate acyltransferase
MLVGNHQSNLDPVFLATGNPRRLYAMGKAELFENPLSRWFYLHLGAFPIHRGKPDRAGLKKIIDLFNRGNMVLVFPEGGRNREPGLGPMEPGIVFLADMAGVPILPAGITGSGKISPKGAKTPRFPKVSVRFGQLFWLDDIAPKKPNMSAIDKKERQELLLKAVSGRIKQLSDDAF